MCVCMPVPSPNWVLLLLQRSNAIIGVDPIPWAPFHYTTTTTFHLIFLKFLFGLVCSCGSLGAVCASRGQRAVVLVELTVVGVQVRAVDLAGLARHVGQQFH